MSNKDDLARRIVELRERLAAGGSRIERALVILKLTKAYLEFVFSE